VILSVSPNVALDRVVVVDGFAPGRQSRARLGFWQAGGSGCHASSVIQELGVQTVALGFIGGHTGALWQKAAAESGLQHDMILTDRETRVSFCIVDENLGSVVESVETGPDLDPSHREELLERVARYLPEASLLILSGSLPPGLSVDTYAALIRMSRAYGVHTLIDAHSQPLREALTQTPWLVKLNLDEFQHWLGRPAVTLEERAAASLEMTAQHTEALVLSMAGEGVLLTVGEEQWHLLPPAIDVHLPHGAGINVIGSGDALVGAMAATYRGGATLLEAVQVGLAAAHVNLGSYGVPEVDATAVHEAAGQVIARRL